MAADRKLVNLDGLILDKEDAIPRLKISGCNGDSSVSSQDDSDSDSSYGEMARDAARNMDQKILEAQIKKEEKNKRIKLARAEKAKELEKKQNQFGKSKNVAGYEVKLPHVNNSFVGTSNTVKNNKYNKSTKKDPNKTITNITESDVDSNTVKSNKYKQNTKKDSNKVMNRTKIKTTNSDVGLPSKLRNITIQQFDIESDHNSGEDVEADGDERIKSFKMKNLNRVELDEGSETDSLPLDDGESVPTRHFISAQKSSAANRRKKSSYLNKRSYKVNQRQAESRNESVEVEECESQTSNKTSPRQHIKEKFSDKLTRNIVKTKADPPSLDKTDSAKGSKFNNQYTTNFKSEDRQPSQSKTNAKNKYKWKDRKNKNEEPCSSSRLHSNNTNMVELTHKTEKLNFDSDRKKDTIPINPIDDGSFVVLQEISLVNAERKIEFGLDDGFRFHFEKSPQSSDNEIDWITVKGYQNKSECPSSEIIISDSEDDLDFNLILVNRKAKQTNEVKQSNVKSNRARLSSSDCEVEFNASLVEFDKIK